MTGLGYRGKVAAIGLALAMLLEASLANACFAGEARIVKVVASPGEHPLPPIIDDRGEIAFGVGGEVQHPDVGVWVYSKDGTVRQSFRHDSVLPDVPAGATLRLQPGYLRLNQRGHLVFGGYWSHNNQGNEVIWWHDPDQGIQTVVMRESEAPGMDGYFITNLSTVDHFTSGKRPVLFFEAQASKGVKPANGNEALKLLETQRSGRWSKRWDEEAKLLMSAPPTELDLFFIGNDRGDLLVGSPWSPNANLSLKLRLFDGPQLSIIDSTDAISLGGRSFSIHSVNSMALNSNRSVALWASVLFQNTVGQAVILREGGAMKPLLYDGPQLPGVEVHPIEVNCKVLLNDRGHILLYPTHCNEGKPQAMILLADNQPPKTLADTSAPAPGTNEPFQYMKMDERTGFAGRDDAPYTAIQFNDRDQVAFIGKLGGKASPENNSGIWFLDADKGQSHLVARTGDQVTLPSGEIKTIRTVLMTYGENRGGNRALNADGTLTYALRLDDESLAYVVDDRFATPGATDDSVSQHVVNREQVERACDEWEQLADARLESLESQRQQSDQLKLERLAEELKGEYRASQRRLASLLSVSEKHELNPDEYVAAVRSLQVRIRELPAIWRALSEWEFFQVTPRKTQDEIEFTRKSIELLRDYELFPALAERVLAKSEQLQGSSQENQIKAAGARDEVFGRRSRQNSFRAAAFEEPIGTLTRGLLPESPARQDEAVDAKPAEGPLDLARQPLSQLAKLTLTSNGRLDVDRMRWSEATGNLTAVQAKRKAYEQLRQAGLSDQTLLPEFDERHPFDGRLSWMGGHPVPITMELFNRIQEATGEPHSRGSSGGGASISSNFESEKIAGRMESTEQGLFRLQLTELVAPWRIVEFESRESDRLRLVIISDENTFVLSQASDGAVRCAITRDNYAEVQTAKDFAELYRTRPEFVMTQICDYLETIGMKGPAKPEGAALRTAVINRLKSAMPGVRQLAEKTIESLESPDYERRQEAYSTLSRNAALYRPILEKYLKDDPPVETRTQLERLIAFAKEQSDEYDTLVEVLSILQSEKHLAELKKDASDEDRMLLDAQLRTIKSP